MFVTEVVVHPVYIYIYIYIYTDIHRQAHTQTYTDRHTHKQTDTQADRHTHIYIHTLVARTISSLYSIPCHVLSKMSIGTVAILCQGYGFVNHEDLVGLLESQAHGLLLIPRGRSPVE